MRSSGRLSVAFATLGLMAVALACGDDEPAGPVPAVLEVAVSGGTPPGAVLFLIEGGVIDSVESAGWFTASAPYSGVARQVVVAGPALVGAIALVHVPDGRVSYRAAVREVAQAGTHALLPAADYQLTVTRR